MQRGGQPTTFTLENGLRVVLDPCNEYEATGVAVHYNVGFRSEPLTNSGIAHLCEHILCDGAPEALVDDVLAAGGVLNATTVADHTHYYGIVPPGQSSKLLRLEAERMATRVVEPGALIAQTAIVKDEIRANIDGQAFGGFPWMFLSSIAYKRPNNRHNGYGSEYIGRLQSGDIEHFLDEHYSPANAVLTVSGTMEPDRVANQVVSLFGAIAKGGAGHLQPPVVSPHEEPALSEDRVATHRDSYAPHPATAVCFRAPDPAGLPEELLAAVLLADIMASDPLGRLDRRCAGSGISMIGTYVGLFGNPFDSRGPIPWVVEAYHDAHLGGEQVIDLVRDELSRVASGEVTALEVERASQALSAQLWRTQDQTLGRMLLIGAAELIHGSAAGVLQLPARIQEVTVEDIRHAAATLVSQKVATLCLEAS